MSASEVTVDVLSRLDRFFGGEDATALLSCSSLRRLLLMYPCFSINLCPFLIRSSRRSRFSRFSLSSGESSRRDRLCWIGEKVGAPLFFLFLSFALALSLSAFCRRRKISNSSMVCFQVCNISSFVEDCDAHLTVLQVLSTVVKKRVVT